MLLGVDLYRHCHCGGSASGELESRQGHMDGSQNGGAAGANNSSDFVRCHSSGILSRPDPLTATIGAKVVQVSDTARFRANRARIEQGAISTDSTDGYHRMLEDPSYASVVRWGDEMDSFVVLEVSMNRTWISLTRFASDGAQTERKIHQVNPPEALQTQQLRELCPATEQVRLPQSAA